MNRWLKLLGAVLMPFWLMACGGGTNSSTDTPSLSGKVTVALTDAPSDLFESVGVTIQSITFIGGESQTPIPLPGGQPVTVDLLALDGLNMLLAQATIPAGTYNKIRLEMSDPVLVQEDGTAVPSEEVVLVGGGKIDLNPQGPFTVKEGGDLVIQLDFDVEKSLQINETGNGRYILRPEVFITVLDGSTPSLDLEETVGVVESIDYSAKTFSLRTDSDMVIEIVTTEETLFSNSGGGILGFGDLRLHQRVGVEGSLTETGAIAALSVEIHGRHLHRHGVIKDLDLDRQQFILMRRDLSQQVVAFTPETMVLFGREHLAVQDLANGQYVKVAGTFDPSTGRLLADKIRIRPEYFRGLITSPPNCPESIHVVNPRAKLYRLRLAGIELVPENTITVQLGSARIHDWRWRVLICSDLAEGEPVRVMGRLIPHIPDSQDPNPIQVLAYGIQKLRQAHVTGKILSIHPDFENAQVGTLVLEVQISGIFWSAEGEASTGRPLRVRVTAHTMFEEGMSFNTLAVGQEVEVRGFFTFRYFHPHVALVAVLVKSVEAVLTNPD